jgi:isopentenyl phosphate kinase
MNIQSSRSKLYFLKLGGSLITNKTRPRTPRIELISRLAGEIRKFLDQKKDIKLLLGHGSGSFGHVPAQKYGTRQGVETRADWMGFAEVWFEASTLNRIVTKELHKVGLPVISLPISAGVTTNSGQVSTWNLDPICSALDSGLLPVIYGDVAFDSIKGGTIFSTEDIFTHLAKLLRPERIFLAGIEQAVYLDYPHCEQPIPSITPKNWDLIAPILQGSGTTDVTGGMASKVRLMLDLIDEIPELVVHIFSGSPPGQLTAVLNGALLGTQISQSKTFLNNLLAKKTVKHE